MHYLAIKQFIILKQLEKNLIKKLENNINTFFDGTNGDFDDIALEVCRKLRRNNKQIIIIVVAKTNAEKARYYRTYGDIDIKLFDLKDIHYTKRIIPINELMIDSVENIICYTNIDKSEIESTVALNYAKSKNKQIENLLIPTLILYLTYLFMKGL